MTIFRLHVKDKCYGEICNAQKSFRRNTEVHV